MTLGGVGLTNSSLHAPLGGRPNARRWPPGHGGPGEVLGLRFWVPVVPTICGCATGGGNLALPNIEGEFCSVRPRCKGENADALFGFRHFFVVLAVAKVAFFCICCGFFLHLVIFPFQFF